MQAITKLELLGSVCLFLLGAQVLVAQQPGPAAETKYVVERIDLIDNRRVRTDTLLAQMRVRPGDAYSVEAVQRDVQSLLKIGFFEDVRSEVEDSPSRPNGKIVIFILREKPIIARVDYKGVKSMTESNIRAAFRDQEIKLSVGDWFDETDLKRAVDVVTQLLASHGYQSATVKPIFERDVSSSTVTITFDVEEGPKTKK